jgi:hypothetical protein
MWQLFVGKKCTGLKISPDLQWAGVWRIRASDGWISDMVNLARAKECARLMSVVNGQQAARWVWQ